MMTSKLSPAIVLTLAAAVWPAAWASVARAQVIAPTTAAEAKPPAPVLPAAQAAPGQAAPAPADAPWPDAAPVPDPAALPVAGPQPAAEEAGKIVSLTVSPLHLVMPVVEVTAEVRLSDRFGLAALLGAGTVDVETRVGDTVVDTDTFDVFELGAQGRVYTVGDFDHGMQLGLEALWVHVSGEDLQGTKISGAGAGLAIGPFIGYKIATRVGFTFEGQLGFQYMAMKAEASDEESGVSAEDSDTDLGPLLNLNIGWSF